MPGYAAQMLFRLPKLVRGLDPRRLPSLPDLGERELLVLEVLWQRGQGTAQTVRDAMPDAGVSLSTVQSTLERLHRKQLVLRSKEGRAYQYSPGLSRDELISGLLRDLADNLAAGQLAPMISGFLGYLSSEAPDLAAGVTRALADADGEEAADDD